MPQRRLANPGSISYFISLAGLALLPLAPELVLLFRSHEDLKLFAPVGYYEGIVSYLLLAPALFVNRLWSRIWVLAIGSLMGVATLIVGFQAASIGARWDVTAHAALMQTSPGEALGFLRSFISPGSVAWVALITAGFAICIAVNYRSSYPRRRAALAAVLLGFIGSTYGIHNALKYGREVFHPVPVSTGAVLKIANVGINKFHPVTLLLATDYNYRVTHEYYLQAYRKTADHIDQFRGAVPVRGAVSPRLVVVVIGESASRRHWSLYGYSRETNPELRKLGSEVLLFSDVISSSVGTQTVLRAMFSTDIFSIPIFPLFSTAGYTTHWISAQYNQGANDVEVAALVQATDHHVFLNGSYDESLLPFIRQAASAPGNHIIFVNLFGSHVRYEDRYPANYSVFRGENQKERLIATYDNSICYTDHVLAEIVELIRQRHEVSCLLYVSDHAEDVYDSTPDIYLFRSDAIATNAMYEVPFLVWFSPEYRQGNPDFVRAVGAARDRKYQTLALYQSLIELTRLMHPLFDRRISLFSPDYVERKRHVGVAGRIYRKEK
jgi:glucan phosphoethanolaminetransferase (alkaline phosphatase superfamily)